MPQTTTHGANSSQGTTPLPNSDGRTTTRLGDEELIVEPRPWRNPHGRGKGIALPDHPAMHDLVVIQIRFQGTGRIRNRLPTVDAPCEISLARPRGVVTELLRNEDCLRINF